VATVESEIGHLDRLGERALANGVEDVRLLSAAEVMELEPALSAAGGLTSPSTGIVDSHSLMQAYLGDAEASGAVLALNSQVVGGSASNLSIELHVGGSQSTRLECELVVNAAGLYAWEVTESIAGIDRSTIPRREFVRGVYFTLKCRSPFSHLIYPVPEPGGLAIDLPMDLSGQARFGPDVEWIDEVSYSVDQPRERKFYPAIRRYWRALPDNALQPGYAGVRPKIVGPGSPDGDFVVQGPIETANPRYIALYGIESPGLTASLAIAEMVATLALESGVSSEEAAAILCS